MNDKENTLYKVVDIVVECTSMEIDGEQTITREDLLGSSRKQNVNMARCILVSQLMFSGFSRETIAQLIGRTIPAVGHMLTAAHQFKISSPAYRIAEAEVTLKCRDIFADI